MNDARRICTRLMANAHVLRTELPELDIPRIRDDVRQRLAAIGHELVDTSFSEYYSTRPNAENLETLTSEATNFGLKENELAMFVILWCRLVSPKRLGGTADRIHPDTIVQEFERNFGGRRNTLATLTRLEKLDMIRKQEGFYTSGPGLESFLDGAQLTDFMNQRGILVEVRDRVLRLSDERHMGPREIVLEFVKGAKDWLFAKDIAMQLNLDGARVKAALKELVSEGRVEQIRSPGRPNKFRRKE